MGFRLLILAVDKDQQDITSRWPERLKELVPDIQVDHCRSVDEAIAHIGEADAAWGHIVPELFDEAKRLRWVACPWAGPPAGYYHQPLIDSDVVVTNVRGIYNDHISAHILAFVLAFARGLHLYLPQQLQRTWRPGHPTVHLPEASAIVVGVGEIGAETARLCAEFGLMVIGVDARRDEAPSGVAEVHPPEALERLLPRGDFVIVTAPETPQTQGMFAAEQFRAMKQSAYFINIGRGATVVLDDLVSALRDGEIAGAGLDVFQSSPSPKTIRSGRLQGCWSPLTWPGRGRTWKSAGRRSSSTTVSGSTRDGP